MIFPKPYTMTVRSDIIIGFHSSYALDEAEVTTNLGAGDAIISTRIIAANPVNINWHDEFYNAAPAYAYLLLPNGVPLFRAYTHIATGGINFPYVEMEPTSPGATDIVWEIDDAFSYDGQLYTAYKAKGTATSTHPLAAFNAYLKYF